ncbi:MAG: glycosyl hydrolase [Bacteroidales bacterium]|jgi:glucosylceramidase|nr:glycosyl hydrolase [Bacteroidales bacterium]
MMTKNVLLFVLSAISAVAVAQDFWQNRESKTRQVILTDLSSNKMFAEGANAEFTDFVQPKETDVCVFVVPALGYQKLIGIGGAITDASAETFALMSKEQQVQFIEAYYGTTGIGYSLARTNMNSCDFSSDTYVYVQDFDTELKTFDIRHDEKYKIPLIKLAQEKAGKDSFKVYFSPWSPPAWMKTNNDMLHGGSLKKEYYGVWADYYIRFIQEYEKRGINFWGLSIQNEPMAVQRWESCIYTADEEAEFLGGYLGEKLAASGYADKKVIIWDHNRDLMFQRASQTLANPKARQYASGIGFHWYETWHNKSQLFGNEAETAKAFPDKFLIFTEGCKENFRLDQIYDRSLGELYARNMIHDFNIGTAAWTDWNILLDETGGPNHVSNFCFAPVIFDRNRKALLFSSEYYYIGHFSKYIRPNAQRLATSTNKDNLLATAFRNVDGTLAVVLMNESDRDSEFNLCIDRKAAKLFAPAHSIQTVIL